MRKLLPLLLFLAPLPFRAANGDTTHVVTHNQVLVVTDPSTGWNEYKAWGVFPSQSTSCRKLVVTMSYKCPTGWACGEWDYIDQIWLRRAGSVDSVSKNLELVRFITPYGNGFNSSWNFQWHADITDFAPFLHDSVEIGYVHTGYETNSGKGWVVTLDFAFIEGPAVRPFIGMSKLVDGGFSYGNSGDPIENHLTPDTVAYDANATLGRIYVSHTGHGMDNNQNCSEFCSKYRDLFIDGSLAERFYRWRKCGHNALFPQGGTWVYDRANWCPGAVVFPWRYDHAISGGSSHVYDIDMEPYSNGGGNEYIIAYLLQYGAPAHTLEASLEEMLQPSSIKEYARFNPICDNPKVVLRNNGSATLSSAVIKYGFEGYPEQSYAWSGNLAIHQIDTVELGGTVIPPMNNAPFRAYISSVNGNADAYPKDDTLRSLAGMVTGIWDTALYLDFRTNAEPWETSYELYNENGTAIYSRPANSLVANTIYKDTFHLAPGCYRFVLHDEDAYGGDGLSFWANSAAGSGYARLRKVANSAIIKSFATDFGSIMELSFTVGLMTSTPETPGEAQAVSIYPNPSSGRISIDVALSSPQSFIAEVYDMTGRLIEKKQLNAVADTRVDFDLEAQANGIYLVKVYNDSFTTTKKIVLQR